jgi:protoheme IX farnesyltransferase
MAFGLALSALSVVVMLVFTTPLAALFSTLGIVYYAWFYTQWLKRSTWQNIVVGGGAGAIPPLVGWTAVTGQLSIAAVVLFAIIFYWTPPHFWALALVKQKDYARAGVPMLPVVAGDAETRRQIVLYSYLLAPVGALPWLLGYAGLAYGAVAVVGGALFVAAALRLRKAAAGEATTQAAMALFGYSILYLVLLFAVLLVEKGTGWSYGLIVW